MATTNLYLDKKELKNPTYIMLSFSDKGNRIRISTGEKILPKHWNMRKQKAKYNYTGCVELNEFLDKFSKDVLRINRKAKTKGMPVTVSYIKEELYPEATKGINSIWDLIEMFIENTKHNKKPSIISVYESTRKHLKEFETARKYRVDFDTINSTFYEKFVAYLMDDLKLTNNTIGKYIKTLKTFLHYAAEKGVNKNDAFKKFKVFKEKAEIIYLTRDELEAIQTLDLSDKKHLKNTKDLFLLACYTGLRYSDFSAIKPENIKKDTLLLTTIKTKQKLTIPIVSTIAKDIIKRYAEGKVHKISEPRMNEYLKEIGQMAGINEPTEKVTHRGAERLTLTLPKYKLISTHAGRRTFITQSLERGMRPEVIMEITGHTDWRSFKKYIKITDEIKVIEMRKAWGEQLKVA